MAFRCVLGGSRAAREALARELAEAEGLRLAPQSPVWRWPFQRNVLPSPIDGPHAVWLPDLHLAFLTGQTPGTRLVLTQSTYQLQRWLDWLDTKRDVTVVAHANRRALARSAAEAFSRRGPWQRIDLIDLGGEDEEDDGPGIVSSETALAELRAAFDGGTPEERLDASARAAAADTGNPAIHLAAASAHMELQDLPSAQAAIERALTLAQDWEAPWFEYGKLWLRSDDLEQAAERFAEAARLMPSFSAALSNLGAALAETDRPEEAIDALHRALRYDPDGYSILNNLGVICREAGRLDEAVEAAERVVRLAPEFVFGHYNLGHALFLQGRFEAARDAYARGQSRDPRKNPVQAGRLAVARVAAGEVQAGVDEFAALAAALPAEACAQLLEEAETTLEALSQMPGSPAGVRAALATVEELRKRKAGPDPS
ncbi:MAG TPA: tetratricopeptide repeat protein [Vicinamibacterales bacterium]|nr:tetratricopeptide repeat protein [Vicinamibacterales bacterium]